MKKIAIAMVLVFTIGLSPKSQAQILKGFGKRIEKKIEDRIDRKADRSVDKVLDKADKETDKPLDDALNKPSKKKDKKTSKNEESQASTNSNAAATSSGDSESPSSASLKTQSLADGVMMMPGGDCSSFIWFKTGAMMEFEVQDGAGKGLNKTKMTVSKVSKQGEITVADVKTSDGEGNDFDMQFKCAGDKMYMDFGAMIQQAMAKAGESGADDAAVQRALESTEIGFDEGFMSFPSKMYPGQELDDVSVSIKTSPTPQMTMEVTTTLTDRKVEGKEKVTTSAGTFDCMKISGVRKTSMKVMGMNKNMKPTTEYMWFSPGIGVIKQEDYNEKGKLNSKMQLSAYKL